MSSFRWLLLAGLLGAIAAAPAQPPAKSKTPPTKEEEDPNAKPVKTPPRIDDEPKPEPGPADGPGVPPPSGVLVVGVRSLPELMSPAFARTDSERMALDLIFEGLLRPAVDGAAGRVYEPALARELPRLVPRGREFTLTNATWADPAQPNNHPPVTNADVRSTFDALKKKRKGQPGAEVADQIDSINLGGTPRQLRIVFERGQIDPLALFTFKVLPNFRPEDLTFARKPVGSGPFMYAGRETKGGREYAIFPANPNYGKRPDVKNLPRLKEVWMVASRNPVADFKGGLFHFALTSHTGELATLKPAKPAGDEARQTGKLEVIIGNAGRVDTLASRRIYFLAVNHKVPTLGGERARDLRRMLAYSIQRDAILTACFRAGFGEHHQPLNGPFPPNTWPCSDRAGALDDADLARSLARKGGKLELQLKYPGGDPAVAEACKLIAQQVAEVNGGVSLVPKAVDPADYYQDVFLNTNFQLAFWHYDYPDEWFSQTGLFAFDPAALGHQGRNFMRYDPDAGVKQLLARCQDRRDFGEVRAALRQWHLTFAREMPFIPLWHLDTHALLATGLSTVPPAGLLDPLAPFTHIEQWAVR
jgi:peptide/nickel transport system substrate-binding protein